MQERDVAEVRLSVARIRLGSFVNTMPTTMDFRNFAEACNRLAQSAGTDASRKTLLSMATKWTGLAVQAERIRQLVREADAVLDVSGLETEKTPPRPRSTKTKVEAGSAQSHQAGADGEDLSAGRALNS